MISGAGPPGYVPDIDIYKFLKQKLYTMWFFYEQRPFRQYTIDTFYLIYTIYVCMCMYSVNWCSGQIIAGQIFVVKGGLNSGEQRR